MYFGENSRIVPERKLEIIQQLHNNLIDRSKAKYITVEAVEGTTQFYPEKISTVSSQIHRLYESEFYAGWKADPDTFIHKDLYKTYILGKKYATIPYLSDKDRGEDSGIVSCVLDCVWLWYDNDIYNSTSWADIQAFINRHKSDNPSLKVHVDNGPNGIYIAWDGYITYNRATGHTVVNPDILKTNKIIYKLGLRNDAESVVIDMNMHSTYYKIPDCIYFDRGNSVVKTLDPGLEYIGMTAGTQCCYEMSGNYYIDIYCGENVSTITLPHGGDFRLVLHNTGIVDVIYSDDEQYIGYTVVTLPSAKDDAIDIVFSVYSDAIKTDIYSITPTLVEEGVIKEYIKKDHYATYYKTTTMIHYIKDIKAFDASGHEDTSLLIPHIAYRQKISPIWNKSLMYTNYSWRTGNDALAIASEPYVANNDLIICGNRIFTSGVSVHNILYDKLQVNFTALQNGTFNLYENAGFYFKGVPTCLIDNELFKKVELQFDASTKVDVVKSTDYRLCLINEFELSQNAAKVSYRFSVKGGMLAEDVTVPCTVAQYVNCINESQLLDWSGHPANSYYCIKIANAYLPVKTAYTKNGYGVFEIKWASKRYIVFGKITGCSNGILELEEKGYRICDISTHSLPITFQALTVDTDGNPHIIFGETDDVPVTYTDVSYIDANTNFYQNVRYRVGDGTGMPSGSMQTYDKLYYLGVNNENRFAPVALPDNKKTEDYTYCKLPRRKNPEYIPPYIPNPGYDPTASRFYYLPKPESYKFKWGTGDGTSPYTGKDGGGEYLSFESSVNIEHYIIFKCTNPNAVLKVNSSCYSRNYLSGGSSYESVFLHSHSYTLNPDGYVEIDEHGYDVRISFSVEGLNAGDKFTVFHATYNKKTYTWSGSINPNDYVEDTENVPVHPNPAYPPSPIMPNPDYDPNAPAMIDDPNFVPTMEPITVYLEDIYYANSLHGDDGKPATYEYAIDPSYSKLYFDFKVYDNKITSAIRTKILITLKRDDGSGITVFNKEAFSIGDNNPYRVVINNDGTYTKVRVELTCLSSSFDGISVLNGSSTITGTIKQAPSQIPNPDPASQEYIPNPNYESQCTEWLEPVFETVKIPSINTQTLFVNGPLYKTIDKASVPVYMKGTYTFRNMDFDNCAVEFINGKVRVSGTGVWYYNSSTPGSVDTRSLVFAKAIIYYDPATGKWSWDSDSVNGTEKPYETTDTVYNLEAVTNFDSLVNPTNIVTRDVNAVFKASNGPAYLEVHAFGNLKIMDISTDITADTNIVIEATKSTININVNGTSYPFSLGENPESAINNSFKVIYWNRNIEFIAEPIEGAKVSFKGYTEETLTGFDLQVFDVSGNRINNPVVDIRPLKNYELEDFDSNFLDGCFDTDVSYALVPRMEKISPYGLSAQGAVEAIQNAPSIAAPIDCTPKSTIVVEFDIKAKANIAGNSLIFSTTPGVGSVPADINLHINGYNCPQLSMNVLMNDNYTHVVVKYDFDAMTGYIKAYGQASQYPLTKYTRISSGEDCFGSLVATFFAGTRFSGIPASHVFNSIHVKNIDIYEEVAGVRREIVVRKKPNDTGKCLINDFTTLLDGATTPYPAYGFYKGNDKLSNYKGNYHSTSRTMIDELRMFKDKYIINNDEFGYSNISSEFYPKIGRTSMVTNSPDVNAFAYIDARYKESEYRTPWCAMFFTEQKTSRSYGFKIADDHEVTLNYKLKNLFTDSSEYTKTYLYDGDKCYEITSDESDMCITVKTGSKRIEVSKDGIVSEIFLDTPVHVGREFTFVIEATSKNIERRVSMLYFYFTGTVKPADTVSDLMITPFIADERDIVPEVEVLPFRRVDCSIDDYNLTSTVSSFDGGYTRHIYNDGDMAIVAGSVSGEKNTLVLGNKKIFEDNGVFGGHIFNYEFIVDAKGPGATLKFAHITIPLQEGKHSYKLKFYNIPDKEMLMGRTKQYGELWYAVSVDGGDFVHNLFTDFTESTMLHDGIIMPGWNESGWNTAPMYTNFIFEVEDGNEIVLYKGRIIENEFNQSWRMRSQNPVLNAIVKDTRNLDLYLVIDNDKLLYGEIANTILKELPVLLENADRYDIDLRVCVYTYCDTLNSIDSSGVPKSSPQWYTGYEDIMNVLKKMPLRDGGVSPEANVFGVLQTMPDIINAESAGRNKVMFLYNSSRMVDYPLTAPEMNAAGDEIRKLDLDTIDAVTTKYIEYGIYLHMAYNQNYHPKDYMYGVFYRMVMKRDLVDDKLSTVYHYYNDKIVISGSEGNMDIDGPVNTDGYPVYIDYMKLTGRPNYNLISDFDDVDSFVTVNNSISAANIFRHFIKDSTILAMPVTYYEDKAYYIASRGGMYKISEHTPVLESVRFTTQTQVINPTPGFYQQRYDEIIYRAFGTDVPYAPFDTIGRWNADNLVRKGENFKAFYRTTRRVDKNIKNYYHVLLAVAPSDIMLFGKSEKQILKDIINKAQYGDIISVSCITRQNNAYDTWFSIRPTLIYNQTKKERLLKDIDDMQIYPDYQEKTNALMSMYFNKLKNYYAANKGIFSVEDISYSSEDYNVNVLNLVMGRFDNETTHFDIKTIPSYFPINTRVQTVVLEISDNDSKAYKDMKGYFPYGVAKTKHPEEARAVIERELEVFNRKRCSFGHIAMELIGTSDKMSEVNIIRDVKDASNVQGAVYTFVGYTKINNPDQLYDVGFIIFGRLYGLKLTTEPMQYTLYFRNDKTSRTFSDSQCYGRQDVVFEAFYEPEDNYDPTKIQPCEMLIVDKFVYCEEKYSPHMIYFYADGENYVIDRLNISAMNATPNMRYVRPPINMIIDIDKGYEKDAEGKYTDYIGSTGMFIGVPSSGGNTSHWWDRPSDDKEPVTGIGTSSPFDGTPGGSNTTGDHEYNPPDRFYTDSIPEWPTPTPNWPSTPDLPQLPPKTHPPVSPQVCVRDWIKNLVLASAMKQFTQEKWDEIIANYGSIQSWLSFYCNDITKWTVVDENGTVVNYVIDETLGCPTLGITYSSIKEVRHKTLYSDVYEYTLKKPTTREFIQPENAQMMLKDQIDSDADLINCKLNGLHYSFDRYFIEDDYAFVDSTSDPDYNPYDRNAARTLDAAEKGDIEVYNAADGIWIRGGWVGQEYSGTVSKSVRISHKTSWTPVLFRDDLAYVLKNCYDELYTGLMDTLTNYITVDNMDSGVLLDWTVRDNVLLTAKATDISDSIVVHQTFNDAEPSKTFAIADLVTLLPDESYDFRLFIVDFTGNISINGTEYHDGDSIYFNSDSDTEFTIEANDIVIYKPWEETKTGFSGIVNGKEPYRKAYDGKQDYIVNLEPFDLPDGLINLRQTVEIENTPEIIIVRFEHEVEPGVSNVNGDLAYFTCGSLMPWTFVTDWVSTSVESDLFTLDSVLPSVVNIKVYNPKYEDYKDSVISNIHAVITSNDPNVKVISYDKSELTFEPEEDYREIPVTVKALPSAMSQWYPVIHNGYYYINNHEYFLYSKNTPDGEYSEEDQIVTKDLVYAIDIIMKSSSPEGVMAFNDSTAPDFTKGTKDGVVFRNAGLECAYISDTQYYKEFANGTYTSEEILLDKETPVEYLNTTYRSNTPDGTEIRLYMSAYDYTAKTWTDWVYVQNNTVPQMLVSKRIKYKVTLKPLNEIAEMQVTEVDDDLYDFFGIDGTLARNVTATSGCLENLDKSTTGEYYSVIKDYNTAVLRYTLEVEGTGNYTVEFATSDNKTDLTETATWIPAADAATTEMKQFVRYKVTLNGDATVTKITRTASIRSTHNVTPNFGELTIRYVIGGDRGVGETITQTVIGKLPRDGEWHDLIDTTLQAKLYPSIVSNGFKITDLLRLSVKTNDSTVEFDYQPDGKSGLKARSSKIETAVGPTPYIKFTDNTCVVTPIPQQFDPVIVFDEANGKYFTRVNFTDSEGRLTLTNVETFTGEGRSGIALSYTDIDPASLKITIDETEVDAEDYDILNNIIRFKYAIPEGAKITAEYSIKDSFIVDYNYKPEEDKAQITVHSDSDLKKIKIYYETNKSSANLIADVINLNTLYCPENHGFIYITDDINECESVEIMMNPTTLWGNGLDSTTVYVRALDSNLNPVAGEKMIIDAIYGKIVLTDNVSDQFGVVSFKYIAPNAKGTDTITVNVYGKDITNTVNVTLR
jgi:hypothetical protein